MFNSASGLKSPMQPMDRRLEAGKPVGCSTLSGGRLRDLNLNFAASPHDAAFTDWSQTPPNKPKLS